MTTIAQQLDNVLALAPCPFCDSPAKFGQVPFEPQTDDSGAYYIACTNKVCDAGMGFRFACGEDPRPQMAVQWNKRAIRAAVGGEAVAWPSVAKRVGDDWEARTALVTHSMSEAQANTWNACRAACIGAYSRATPLYASPTATVDVGALRGYCDELRARADQADGEIVPGISGKEIVLLRDIADELAALIGEKA